MVEQNRPLEVTFAIVLIFATLVTGIAVGTVNAAIIADSVSEFSGVQGQNNWYYGYYDGPFTSSDFQLMTQFIPNFNPPNRWWVQEGTYWTSLFDGGGSPNGLNGNQGRLPILQWAVRRWVSEVAGTITISDTFASLGGGDITVYIIVDGVQIWSQYIPGAGSSGNYTVNTNVQVGSTVDFAIDPGPAGVDINDTAEFTSTIDTIDVGGSVTGVSGKTVICRNMTTGQSVKILLGGAKSWNCEDAGLVVNPGDRIRQIVTGIAE